MKKLASIFLVLAMILGLNTTAWATENVAVTIENDVPEVVYNGYQLLKLTVSLKTTAHPTGCDGTNHVDGCYNYAYTVNEKYREILQAETLSNGRDELWGTNGKPAYASGVTDAQILEYLSYQSGDTGDVYGTLRQVADRIYRAILAKKITADETDVDGSSINQGYWMFVDARNMSDVNGANSLVVLDTKGKDAITIKEKVAVPSLEKKVKDIDDSKDGNILDNPWYDSADHDIDPTAIPFKLTGTLPSNVQYYTSYTIVFHDSMSDGLTLNEGSFQVFMYDTKQKADEDTDLNDYTKNVTNSFEFKTANLHNADCTFEVSCENVFNIEGVTKDTAFVVYYEASLNENAVHGSGGNPNEAYLEFSNNPYGETTGATIPDKVVVYTYQVIVNKTDADNNPLPGAGFTLYKKVLDATGGTANYVPLGDAKGGVNGTLTSFTWTGLDDGDYKLVESTVPEGYNKMEDIVFSILAEHSETADEPQLLSLDGGLMGTGEVSTGAITKSIINNTGTVLPETGAQGTLMLIGGGSLFVLVAAVFMITRKKMSVYAD